MCRPNAYCTGLAPAIPEDLYYMIKKAVVMRKHLEVNRKDKDGKFRLILVESRIHRLARYYKVAYGTCTQNGFCTTILLHSFSQGHQSHLCRFCAAACQEAGAQLEV